MEIDAHTPELVAVGVDGSPSDPSTLAWAAAEAAARGRTLWVFHCWQQHTPAMAALPGYVPQRDSAVRRHAATPLDEALAWLARHHPDVATGGTVLHGPAGPRLTAHTRQGDLLVVGSGSRHRLAARVLGSTVDHLLRHARCPLVVVPAAGTRPIAAGPFAGHVVAAVGAPYDPVHTVDLATTVAVLGAAFAAAAAHHLTLAVVNADGTRSEPVGTVIEHPAIGLSLNNAIASWQAHYPQVGVRRVTVSGPAVPVLEHVGEGARLMVIGRSAHPLRPVRLVDHLLAGSSCPVAVVPPTAAGTSVRPRTTGSAGVRLPRPG
jgi:nucleotide-binding universal stress UspA family protein